LEGTPKGHPVQPPWNKQGHLQLDQVAQSPVQPNLECFQGWGIYPRAAKLQLMNTWDGIHKDSWWIQEESI